jgi:hypothetical protein
MDINIQSSLIEDRIFVQDSFLQSRQELKSNFRNDAEKAGTVQTEGNVPVFKNHFHQNTPFSQKLVNFR